MPLRLSVPSMILLLGVVWLARGLPTHPSELLQIHADRPVKYSDLRAGDVISVRYRSTGCFHDVSARLTASTASDGSVQMSVYAYGGNISELGFLRRTLTAQEVNSLDETLAILRTDIGPQLCTTLTTLELSFYRDGKRLAAREVVRDRSCLQFQLSSPMNFDRLVDTAIDGGT